MSKRKRFAPDETPAVDRTDDDMQVVDYDDHDLLGQADWVIGGEAARKARQQGLYAGYVLFLGALVYGLPIVQTVFRTSDAGSLGQQLHSPVAVALLVVSVGALLGAVVFAGRFRGPVVPPMPWIDLVLIAPLDRALALRRWWRYAAVGGLFVGGLSGLTIGAGLAFAQVAGIVAIGVTTVAGAALGVLASRLWLWSQVRSWPGPDRGLSLLWRVPDALRELHSESLRAHSANTSTLTGSALTGNLRTARLALTRPVRHGRSARLRPGRPFGVLVRRDVIGLRRTPGAFLSGLGLALLGGAVVTWAFAQPAAPSIAATIGLLPLYLGFGAWSEGLRLQADNVGTPSLLGTGEVVEALAHLVVPTALTALVLTGWVAVTGLFGPVPVAAAVSLCLVLVLVVAGNVLAAFRGSPTFVLRPQMVVAWYAMPAVTVVLLGSVVAVLTKAASYTWLSVVSWLVYAVLLWAVSRVRRLTYLHRA
ncbi:hypothetical protein [Terrabacter sp. MAHUQ-38]|uniref:hypothetical protein n=1 Tax=unclassified Terrabacter TaxID=2630222 RepID=UPI00165E6041|nr:hypothetical protein [Terrabacter sp. MAHUQ-38]MBC9822587.1 hypothetical protein [Terrabacter sp. MAHUQ-38]